MGTKAETTASEINFAVVAGEVVGVPSEIEVGGEPITVFEVRVRDGGRSTLVPVRWLGSHPEIAVGTRVGIVGAISRRFFRSGAATQSRTEVTATVVKELPTPAKVTRFRSLASGLFL